MKLFACQACGQLLSFENTQCERCGRALGFIPERMELVALDPIGDGTWRETAARDHLVQFCANAGYRVCNWMLPLDAPSPYCAACRLNRTIPDLDRPEHLVHWRDVEIGKHRLVYGLMRLGVPLTPKREQPEVGLAFDFLSPDSASPSGMPVMTGHSRGLITINISEADDAQREQFRANFAEPYRTVLGHFRHEVGHYYWERLVDGTPAIEAFRILFGDERIPYGPALEAYYARATWTPTWPNLHVSAYASAHPWEDWAETWAHYLHLLDTIETAYWYGLEISPRAGATRVMSTSIDIDPYEAEFDEIARVWFPLVFAGNSLNRSMGQPDLYPFILTPPVLDKLRFVHELARTWPSLSSTGL